MKTKEYQLDKLARAHELQDELAALHIPVPVMSWKYVISDKNGDVLEKGVGKANSFTRNALNMLAYTLGNADFALINTSAFGDGILSVKSVTGLIASPNNTNRYSAANSTVYLGSGTTEALNDYSLPSYACNTSTGSSFNSTTRKLVTTISGTYYNSTESAISITESAIKTPYGSSVSYLSVHDVFDAISVPSGATISWAYVIEVAYPNP